MCCNLQSTVCWFNPVFIGVAWHISEKASGMWASWLRLSCWVELPLGPLPPLSCALCLMERSRPLCVLVCVCVHAGGMGVFTGKRTCRYLSLGFWSSVDSSEHDDNESRIGKVPTLHDLCSLDLSSYEGWPFFFSLFFFTIMFFRFYDWALEFKLLAKLCRGPVFVCVRQGVLLAK